MNVSNYSTIAEVTAAVRAKKVSPVELVEAALARIEKQEPKLTAFMNLDAAVARKLRPMFAGDGSSGEES